MPEVGPRTAGAVVVLASVSASRGLGGSGASVSISIGTDCSVTAGGGTPGVGPSRLGVVSKVVVLAAVPRAAFGASALGRVGAGCA